MNVMALPPQYFGAFFLVFTRVAAALFTMPVFSNRSIPQMAKVGLAGVLAFVLVPVQPNLLPTLPDTLLAFVVAVANEALVGLAIGFVALLSFTGLQMAGQLIGLQMGLNIAASLDPVTAGDQVSYIDQFYAIITAVLFLAINGHHQMILAIAQSFQIVPLNSFVVTAATSQSLIGLTAGMFTIALRLSLPLIVTLLMVDLAMLLISRTMPQLNVFAVGQPIKLLLGLVLLLFALPLMLTFMQATLQSIPSDVNGLLRTV